MKYLPKVFALSLLSYSALSTADDALKEMFGLDLLSTDTSQVRLGLYGNDSGDQSTLGVEFKFNKQWSFNKTYAKPQASQRANFMKLPVNLRPTPQELIKIGQGDYQGISSEKLAAWFKAYDHNLDSYTDFVATITGEGLLALKQENNLKDFSTLRAEANYKTWIANQYTYAIGGFSRYETDQSNDNAQWGYGFTAYGQYWFKQGVANEYAFLKIDYAEVNPKDNEQRLSILAGDDDNYYRWEVNATVQLDVSIEQVDKLEFSYRYFYEPGAPELIKQAEMDSFRLATIGVYFDQGWFIAYSDGKLPFSVQDQQIYQIGWSYSFD